MNEEIEKIISNNCGMQDGAILTEYITNLQQEIEQLKEALETKYYCQYANKCNELYDCTREEYETMTRNNMKLSLENAELLEKIDKALKELEYVLPVYTTPIGQVIHLEDKLASIERAIKILGNKENE